MKRNRARSAQEFATKGFTLIELMIVVVVIGVLAAIGVPRFVLASLRSKEAEAPPILKQICTLAEADHHRTNSWAAVPAIAEDGTSALPGWSAPSAQYFRYTFSPAGPVATATPLEDYAADLSTFTMDCASKELTRTEPTASGG